MTGRYRNTCSYEGRVGSALVVMNGAVLCHPLARAMCVCCSGMLL